ncbi:unnamed protein product [Allacma fusca]|uniref:Uncharacterized protein n=1 Tax=Allacma fusca TaxID=39272 RepID=A0A8J2PAI8_9HEXA|nr:unnamed protein product [Allacma fusca]
MFLVEGDDHAKVEIITGNQTADNRTRPGAVLTSQFGRQKSDNCISSIFVETSPFKGNLWKDRLSTEAHLSGLHCWLAANFKESRTQSGLYRCTYICKISQL